MQKPFAELLQAIDDFISARATGDDDKNAVKRIVRARREVGEIRAGNDQLLAVLEAQVAALFQPVMNEKRLCQLLGRDRSWLYKERKAGRWCNYEVDASGGRYYTPEQILANLRGESPARRAAAQAGASLGMRT